MDNIPHLALPLRVVGDRFVTRQQDSDAEAADCVKVILSFPRGQRPEDPDFGIEDPTFQTQPIDVDDIAQAIKVYEPRVDAEIETIDYSDGTTAVNVKVTLPTSDDMPMEE